MFFFSFPILIITRITTVEPYTLVSTVAILMFRAKYLGSLVWMVFCDFFFFFYIFSKLRKGNPYKESTMNTLTFDNRHRLNNKRQ
jgi:hypothetical protein